MKKRQILLKYDEVEYWRIMDLKHKVSVVLGRNLTMKDFIYSAVTGIRLKSQQELLEEADRLVERSLKKHGS